MPLRAVLEHVFEPKLIMKPIIALLNKDGELLIQTPRFGKLKQLLSSKYNHYLVMEHITFFEKLEMTCLLVTSSGSNLAFDGSNAIIKNAFDQLAKTHDFGAIQVLRFKKK